jgi:hypothetical protein
MKLSIKAGATSQSVNVFIRDSSSTTGGGLAAVAPAGGSLLTGTKLYYSFTGANASAGVAVSLSVLAAVNTAWTSAGIVTLDGTNMIGWVRVDIPNAALAASSGRVVSFLLYGGTNMAPTPFEIELTGWDNQDAVHGGMTAMPNAAAGASGGLLINGVNTGTVTLAALTVSGAVAFSSTFAVTTSTSLGALSCTTLTASGAVAFQSTFGVTGATSLAAVSTSGTLTVNAFVCSNNFTVSGNWLTTGTTTWTGAATFTGGLTSAIAGNITGNLTGNVSGSVGTVTGGVTVTTNNDKTGYALLSTGLDLVLVAGKTLPHAIQIIGGTTAGKASGVGTGTEVFQDFASATVATVTLDASNNRTGIVYAV